MLSLEVPPRELFDDASQTFIEIPGGNLQLEHSLISLSKWESITTRPFLHQETLTDEDLILYIKCMTIGHVASPLIYQSLTREHFEQIGEYIRHPQSATTIREEGSAGRDIVTAEVIYSWMCGLDIPFTCEKWHLNRLLKLISVRSIHTKPPKETDPRERAMRNQALNAQRRAKYKTRG